MITWLLVALIVVCACAAMAALVYGLDLFAKRIENLFLSLFVGFLVAVCFITCIAGAFFLSLRVLGYV